MVPISTDNSLLKLFLHTLMALVGTVIFHFPQVVELSYNRIRKVDYDDLHRYPYITHLYLTDNLIAKLDDDIFKDLTSLETLDLSINALNRVPASIFQLPTLKTLYLSQNMNINVAESIENAKPILQSTLTKLDISYITEDGFTTDFPDFSDLPLLAFVNISGKVPKHFTSSVTDMLFSLL